MTVKITSKAQPLLGQGIVSCFFVGSMGLSYACNNQAGMIIASEGLSISVKNMMRGIEGQNEKMVILGAGLGSTILADHLLEPIMGGSFGLTSMNIGCVIKVLDRELNIFLSGKKEGADGNKIKHSREFLILAVTSIAALVFAANKMKAGPVLVDALLSALSTSVKNATKKLSPQCCWSVLLGAIIVASLWDSFQGASGLSKDSVTGLALSLLCKEGVRSIEQFQMGSCGGEDDEEDSKIEKEIETSEEKPRVLPAPMYQQTMLVSGTLSLGLGLGQFSDTIHPVLQSSTIKLAARVFNNMMRQYSFAKSAPVVAATSVGFLLAGGLLSTGELTGSIGNSMISLGQSLPFGELKGWQLGKKVVNSKENKPIQV